MSYLWSSVKIFLIPFYLLLDEFFLYSKTFLSVLQFNGLWPKLLQEQQWPKNIARYLFGLFGAILFLFLSWEIKPVFFLFSFLVGVFLSYPHLSFDVMRFVCNNIPCRTLQFTISCHMSLVITLITFYVIFVE